MTCRPVISLESELTEPGFRLASLSDMSVSGQPRWWASVEHRGAVGFAQAAEPGETVRLAKEDVKQRLKEFEKRAQFYAPSLNDLL